MNIKKTDAIVFAIVVIVAILVLLVVTMQQQLVALVNIFKSYGYVGGFVLGFLSSFTIFIPSPAFIAVMGLATILNPLLLGIATGIGSGIGEMTGYVVGRGAESTIHKRKGHIHKSIVKMQKLFKRYHPDIVIFAFSAIPFLPVDAAGIFCGAIRYNWKRFLFFTIIGKIIKFTALAFISVWGIGWLSSLSASG